MESALSLIDPIHWGIAIAVTLLAGFVKGSVGFAMPMIMISGLGSFLAPDLALAALILPTVLSNVVQSLRGGMAAALTSMRLHRRFMVIFLAVMILGAQSIRNLPPSTMFLIIGIPITLISVSQLMGWRPIVRAESRKRTEAFAAAVAGMIGGVSGVWGPPTTVYLTAIGTPKKEQIRVQGVIYLAGAIVLFFAHLKSGILNELTLQFSFWMLVPAMCGLFVGFWYQDRLDQAKFRRWTLAVLVIAGLNLIRRGLIG